MTTTTTTTSGYLPIKLSDSRAVQRWIPRHYISLSEEHSLGTIEGLEVVIGIQWLYGDSLYLDNPDHAKSFEGYTKEELSRYKTEWDSTVFDAYYRYKKNLHEKQRWGFVGIVLMAFVNGIQVGEKKNVIDNTETGYAPSLNADDFGSPTFLDETGTIANWVENNQGTIKKFAEDRRIEALEFISNTLKKLNE